ncbi:sugar porter family MFS transporter [Marinilongibacter aquaticus]|uniref:sugar porter family MFS transporter n=1 Tax=Marinilongibacter aquaticus TaxID=2975157 RepID=UPI0021BD854C|nr:sugar porter family MFS transporter [Marinilongibacter aquaticus]UBM57225.1 sugar porter family MFS transporter [Marinilongibacter aquaticus]
MNKNTFLYFIAAVAATGGLLFGFDTGVINVALPSLREQFALSPTQESTVVSAVLFGALFGPVLSGILTDLLGRKKINLLASIIFVVGSILAALASSVAMLIVGRLFLGLAIGIVSATIPLYLAELSPKEKRGQLVTFFQLAITLGILLSYVVGYWFQHTEAAWRAMFWAGFIPAMMLFIGMLLVPESPRWLLFKGREEEAIAALNKLRDEDVVAQELQEIRLTLQKEAKNKSSWKDLFSKKLRTPLLIVCLIFGIQQFSGINAIIYFSTDIFKDMFNDTQATLATVGVGIVNTLATIFGMRFLDKWGRKPMLYTGLLGTAICLATVGLAFYFKSSLPDGLRQAMLIGGIYVYIIFFAISLGPLGWLLTSEIFPLKIRGFASSFGSLNHWFFDMLVAFSFPLMRATSLGENGGIFGIYMLVVLLGLLFAKYMVFETKGLSLEDIEKRYE